MFFIQIEQINQNFMTVVKLWKNFWINGKNDKTHEKFKQNFSLDCNT